MIRDEEVVTRHFGVCAVVFFTLSLPQSNSSRNSGRKSIFQSGGKCSGSVMERYEGKKSLNFTSRSGCSSDQTHTPIMCVCVCVLTLQDPDIEKMFSPPRCCCRRVLKFFMLRFSIKYCNPEPSAARTNIITVRTPLSSSYGSNTIEMQTLRCNNLSSI